MKFPIEFWTIFAAVMMANLLTVGFVYSLFLHSKREKGQDDTPWHVIYGGALLPFIFLIGSFYLISK